MVTPMRYDEPRRTDGSGPRARSRNEGLTIPCRSRMISGNITFRQPELLWLLIVPALLLVLWAWQLVRRRVFARGSRTHARSPFASALRPPATPTLLVVPDSVFCGAHPRVGQTHGPATAMRTGGVEYRHPGTARRPWRPGRCRQPVAPSVQFLQIASATSSRGTATVSRWRSSPTSPRHRSRLTKPNVLLLRESHLDATSPFRIEDETTWGHQPRTKGFTGASGSSSATGRPQQVSQRQGVRDGVGRRIVERRGGQVAWRAQDGIPLFVVGVGTLGGGRMPEFKDKDGKRRLRLGSANDIEARSRVTAAPGVPPAAGSTSSSTMPTATWPTRSSRRDQAHGAVAWRK